MVQQMKDQASLNDSAKRNFARAPEAPEASDPKPKGNFVEKLTKQSYLENLDLQERIKARKVLK